MNFSWKFEAELLPLFPQKPQLHAKHVAGFANVISEHLNLRDDPSVSLLGHEKYRRKVNLEPLQ